MAAPIPQFAEQFPMEPSPPGRCYWCEGPCLGRSGQHGFEDRRGCRGVEITGDGAPFRSWAGSVTICPNIPDDVAAVVVDRVVETVRKPVVVRCAAESLRVDEDRYLPVVSEAFGEFPVDYVVKSGVMVFEVLAEASPTDDQWLAWMLMHDAGVESLLEPYRRPAREARAAERARREAEDRWLDAEDDRW